MFYKTADGIDRLESEETDLAAKALPLIHEATFAKRPCGFCQEDEKGLMGMKLIREGSIVPITTTELSNVSIPC